MDNSMIQIQKVDIMAEMEHYNAKMREASMEGCTDEGKIKAYDIGVQNTMNVLKMLLSKDENEEIKDELIYNAKCGAKPFVRYVRLSDAVEELTQSNQLEMIKDGD